MKKFTLLHTAKSVTLLLFVALFAVTCDNSTSADDDDHADAEGFRLVMNGSTLVERVPGGTLSSGIDLQPGEETALITIWFLDDDGDQFHPEGDEYSLGYQFDDQGVVEFEQHTEDGKWSFHLHAEDAENHTDLTLMLMHNDHSDFNTDKIHIHVESEQMP